MAAVTTAVNTGLKLCEPLICVGLKAVLHIPEGVAEAAVKWVKERFTDHSLELTKAVSAAHDRAWQAVALALATDTIVGKVVGLFRDGDMKAVQKQIREFVATADTALNDTSAGLRTKACDQLLRLKKQGRLGVEGVELHSLDLTRFASAAKVADDAHHAIRLIATDLETDAPHLAQVLTLTPPGGGTPLLAAAFAYFLRRQIETNGELFRGLLTDQVRLLTQKQQAGFANVERLLAEANGDVIDAIGGAVAVVLGELDDIKAKLEQLLDLHQVSKKAESPLRVSVTSEAELQRLKKLRDRLREQPFELVDAELQSLLGDGLAAAGQYAEAEQAHAAAVTAAHAAADATAEADAAYKQFKDACELKQWPSALAALMRAVALDEKRFRPVPKHYVIDSILGAGSFGVVFRCRSTISFDDDGDELVLAVKTFRETDLDRPLKDIFGEAHTLKNQTHENVIRIHDHGFADADGQQRPFLAMEFVTGVTLEQQLAAHGKLSVADFTAIFGQIAAALHAAHTGRRPIIHRDLKPANVMVWQDGERWRVKVIDFGLAVRGAVRTTSLSVPHAQRSTRDRSVTGTIKYAAPEQLGEKPYQPGPWSDVFAFGKTGLESLFTTVQPTPRHWKQLPDPLADLLARCVDEEYDSQNPADGRFHGFTPVLDALREMEREADPVAKTAAVAKAKAEEERVRKAEEERRQAGEELQAARRAEVQAEAERLANQQTEQVRQAEQAKRLVEQRAEEERRQEEAYRQSEQSARWEREQREQREEKDRLAAKLAAAEHQRAEQERVAAEVRAKLCAANLEWWKASDGAESWVSARLGGWDDAEWRVLLEYLKRGIHWPMDESAVGRHLETVRERLQEERRREEKRKVTPPPPPPAPPPEQKWKTDCAVCKVTLNFSAALSGKIEECPKCKSELILPTRNGDPCQKRSPLPSPPTPPSVPNWVTKCAGCIVEIEFPPKLAGKLVKCQKCKVVLTLPARNGGPSLRVAERPADAKEGVGRKLQKFEFEATDSNGEEVLGNVEATNEEEAGQNLRAMGYFVTKIVEKREGRKRQWDTKCAGCDITLGFPNELAGKHANCPECQVEMTLPTRNGGPSLRVAAPARMNDDDSDFELALDDDDAYVTDDDADSGDVLRNDAPTDDVPTAIPAGHKYQLALPGGLKMAFAWCPPGKFLMGSPKSEKERGDDELQHEVRLTKGFYCGVHPVTQAEWKAVMKTNRSHFKGVNLPMEFVSWEDAQAFCQKVRELTGKQVRLPTEAEWEYACRGGTTTPFYWGTELNGTQANCAGQHPYGCGTKGPYLNNTSPVGSYAKNFPHPWGLTDVHGNVWEWCADWYDVGFYARSPAADPQCRDGEQSDRVLRGGSWGNFASFCRAAARFRLGPKNSRELYGFRIVFCPD